MLQNSAPVNMEHENQCNAGFSNNLYPASQREWAELIEYPFRTVKDLEAAISESSTQFDRLLEVAQHFRDKANVMLLGQTISKGSKIKGESTSPFYIAYSYDRSYTLLKWRSHRSDKKGNLLNNRRRTALTEDMLSACPTELRENMLRIERRRIELNYMAGIIGFKRLRLQTVLEQIQTANQLRRQL